MSIRLKLSLLLTLLFVSSIGNVVFTYIVEFYWEEKMKWVNHEHEIIHTSESFISSLMAAETGQRGYLLTGDVDYLEPYYSGVVSVEATLERLIDMTNSNLTQQERLAVISKLTNQKLENLEKTID